jgi:hypothetical protein
MHAMNAKTYGSGWLLRRLSAWFLVVVYVATASPLSLAVAAGAAALDRGHRLIVGAGAGERVQVVLHHASAASAHRHGLLARTLVVMAEKNDGTTPDHVIDLPASNICLPESKTETPSLLSVSLDTRPLPAEHAQGKLTLLSFCPTPDLPVLTRLSTQLLI